MDLLCGFVSTKYEMRLFEITGPRLYLLANAAQSEGKTISLEDSTCDLGPGMEEWLEVQRPADCPPRSKTMRLSPSPRAVDYVYMVQPISGLTRNHLGWIKKLNEADPTHEGVVAHFAQGYWSGKGCQDAQLEPWEYRALEVRILKRIGRSASIDAQ